MSDNRRFNLKVLYVEDDEETRQGISETLKLRVSSLDMAKDGKEGLEKFSNGNYDVVITDIKMPVMNGLEMARQIRKLKRNTPIIITTAYNDNELLIECIDIGVNQFVMKPILLSKLMDALEKCMEWIGTC